MLSDIWFMCSPQSRLPAAHWGKAVVAAMRTLRYKLLLKWNALRNIRLQTWRLSKEKRQLDPIMETSSARFRAWLGWSMRICLVFKKTSLQFLWRLSFLQQCFGQHNCWTQKGPYRAIFCKWKICLTTRRAGKSFAWLYQSPSGALLHHLRPLCYYIHLTWQLHWLPSNLWLIGQSNHHPLSNICSPKHLLINVTSFGNIVGGNLC